MSQRERTDRRTPREPRDRNYKTSPTDSIRPKTGDLEHVYLVGSFFKYCGAPWSDPVCEDLSPKGLLGRPSGDPMYVVYARKETSA